MKKIVLFFSFILITQSSYSMDHARRAALFAQQTDREAKWVLIANAAYFLARTAYSYNNCNFDLQSQCFGQSMSSISESSVWLGVATASFHVVTVILRAPTRR